MNERVDSVNSFPQDCINTDAREGRTQALKDPSRVRIAVIVNFLTTYREGFYRRLLATDGIDVKIFCHEPPSHFNLTSIHTEFSANVCIIPGRFILGEKIVLSQLPWRDIFSNYTIVYVEGNPRYLSLAALATALRLANRKVVLWTMVHSFRRSRLGLTLRLAWNRLFDHLLVYSDSEADYLKKRGFAGRIVGINNGVDFDRISVAAQGWSGERLATWRNKNDLINRTLILSCSRLEKKNKFEQVLDVLPRLVEAHPQLLWCVIGAGPEQPTLERLVFQRGLTSHVRFLGRVYREDDLAPWFLSSQLLVHPGAIGLTVLHALAYGVPVVTHHDARHHGPEFAAFIAGQHGLVHKEDNLSELYQVLFSMLGNLERSRAMGLTGQQVVRDLYNTRTMVERFLAMAGHHWLDSATSK